MGWGSIFKAIADIGTDFIPGASAGKKALKYGLQASGALSDVLGGASKGAQKQNNANDQLQLERARTQLDRDKFATTAPGTRLQTGIRAALADTAAPAHVSWGGKGSGMRGEVPTMTGGANSIYSALQKPDTKALSERVMHDELMSQLNNHDTNGVPQVGQSSGFDKALGSAALGTSVLGALDKSGILTPEQRLAGGSVPQPPNLPYQPLPVAKLKPRPEDDMVNDE